VDEIAEETIRCKWCGTEFAGGDSCPQCGKMFAQVPCDEDPSQNAAFRCVICERTVCVELPDAGHAALCEEHRTIPVIEGWAQVYTTASEIEAGLIVENLRAEGMDAQLYNQADRSFPVDLGELSIARVLVPVWEFDGALQLIRSYMDTEGEVVFACPSCGEVYEPGQATCTSCGAALAG
jgi:rubrerythrin